MKPSAIQELLDRRPFRPFEVRMSNGDVYPIRYPNHGILMRATLLIVDPDADTVAYCALDQINSVNVPQVA